MERVLILSSGSESGYYGYGAVDTSLSPDVISELSEDNLNSPDMSSLMNKMPLEMSMMYCKID